MPGVGNVDAESVPGSAKSCCKRTANSNGAGCTEYPFGSESGLSYTERCAPLAAACSSGMLQTLYHTGCQLTCGASMVSGDNLNLATRLVLPLIKYEDRSDSSMLDECCVCLEAFEVDDALNKLSCGHLFHVRCITSWLTGHNFCPLCKQVVSVDVMPIDGTATVTIEDADGIERVEQFSPGSLQAQLEAESGHASRQTALPHAYENLRQLPQNEHDPEQH